MAAPYDGQYSQLYWSPVPAKQTILGMIATVGGKNEDGKSQLVAPTGTGQG